MVLNYKLILLCSVPLLIQFSSHAASPAHPYINIVTENWKPYNYTDTDGSIKGDSTEKVRKILIHAG